MVDCGRLGDFENEIAVVVEGGRLMVEMEGHIGSVGRERRDSAPCGMGRRGKGVEGRLRWADRLGWMGEQGRDFTKRRHDRWVTKSRVIFEKRQWKYNSEAKVVRMLRLHMQSLNYEARSLYLFAY